MQLRVSGLCEDQWILHPGISLAAREQISNCGSLVGISMPEKYSFVCNDCLSYHAVDTLVTRKASMWVYLIICVFVCARQLDVLKISWTLGHVMMCWKVRRRFFLSLRTECVKVSSSTKAKEKTSERHCQEAYNIEAMQSDKEKSWRGPLLPSSIHTQLHLKCWMDKRHHILLNPLSKFHLYVPVKSWGHL